MRQKRKALVDEHKRAVEALVAVHNAVSFYASVNGCVSHDDMRSMLREASAAVDTVRDIIFKAA